VPVLLGPALPSVEYLVEVMDGTMGRPRQQLRRPGGDRHHAEDTIGVQGGGEQGIPAATADSHDHGAVDVTGAHHRDGVGRELGLGVRRGRRRPVRTAVAPRVDGDDLEPAGEIGHLGLPDPAVNDRPKGREHYRGLVLAEHLETDLDAIAVYETFGVWIPGPHSASQSWLMYQS